RRAGNAPSRRGILPRRFEPARGHRSARATSRRQGVPMKLSARIAPLLVLAVLLAGCQKSSPAEDAAGPDATPPSAEPAPAAPGATADATAPDDATADAD